MHNTGRALATQWDDLLGYYCQAWGWHQKTADAVGRMPAGYLVSSQLRGFGRTSAFCHAQTLPFHSIIADPSGFATWGRSLARCSEQGKKTQANRQSISGTSLPKRKRASQGKQFCIPFKARLVFRHERATIDCDQVSQITVLWRVSDGIGDNAVSGLFLCCTHQVNSVNTNYSKCKHQVRVKWSTE